MVDRLVVVDAELFDARQVVQERLIALAHQPLQLAALIGIAPVVMSAVLERRAADRADTAAEIVTETCRAPEARANLSFGQPCTAHRLDELAAAALKEQDVAET